MRLACPGLFSLCGKNVTVVAPSRLLAAVAHQQFAIHQLQQLKQSWLRPSVMSMGAWLTRSWQEARYSRTDVPTLLSPSQEHLLWTQIISAEEPDLFDVDATAQMASRSSRLLAEWSIASEIAEWSDFSGVHQFKHWVKLFRQRCRSEGWVTRPDLWERLPGWISQNVCAAGPVVFLLSGPPVPAMSKLIEAFEGRASIKRLSNARPVVAVPGRGFDQPQHELEFAARWARASFEANPTHSVAVFVPGLPGRRNEIDRAFAGAFYSGGCRALVDSRLQAIRNAPAAYNILPPAPLVSEPVIAGALLLLDLARERIPLSQAGSILRSRWIAGAPTERNARAGADGQLRRLRELDVSLSEMENASGRCPRLTNLWPAVRRVLDGKPEFNTFSGWSKFIGDLLGALGWPGDDDLHVDEQNAVEGWKNVLSQVGALSLVAEAVPFEMALAQLRRLLDSGLDREASLLAPVQILSSVGAAGVEFDSALITGLGEETWPPPRSVTPFIPPAVRRRFQAAGDETDRSAELSFLLTSAPSVAATWSGRLSPAARAFLRNEPNLPLWQGKTTWESYKPAILEETVDVFAPSYQAGETARGGTGIIKSQSLCPFRAFAEYRLLSNSLEEGCLGFDSRDRGGNLHLALQFVWKKLGSFDQLKKTSAPELAVIVKQGALESVRAQNLSSFGNIVAAVEFSRLKDVTLAWLNVERERLQPFTVEMVEEERYLELAGLKLRLRIDRMDRLRNGGLILIDYKSGEQKQKKLLCPRPEEPQLLIYATGMGDEVEGVVFAQLKRDDIRPVGWTRDRHFKKEQKKTVEPLGHVWGERMAESRAEVVRLAEQFKSGYAAVDPKSAGTCNYCAQKPFCRINEQRQEGGPEEE